MSARPLRVLAVLAAGFCLAAAVAAQSPTVPQPVRPINGQLTNANASIFVVTAATSPVGDPIQYDFQVYADPGLTTLVASITNSDRFRRNISGLAPGTTYYWRARSTTEFAASAWSPVATCLTTDDFPIAELFGQIETEALLGCDIPVRVELQLNNYTGYIVTALGQGFRVYSPDGATPTGFTSWWNTDINWASVFPGGVATTANPDGTVRFVATRSGNAGLADATATHVFGFGFTVSCDDVGRTVCIDSATVLPGGTWTWTLSLATLATIRPYWDGPLCFTIAPCCYNTRGDFNFDGIFDPIDLSSMVDYFFGSGGAPVCVAEADIDGADGFTPVDLASCVDYFFGGGAPPAGCE